MQCSFDKKSNSRKIIICSFGIIGWLDPVNCKIDNCYEKQKFQLDFWPHSSLSLIEFFWWSRGGGMTWAISQKVLKFEIFRSRQMMKINLAWSKPSSGSIVWPQLLKVQSWEKFQNSSSLFLSSVAKSILPIKVSYEPHQFWLYNKH